MKAAADGVDVPSSRNTSQGPRPDGEIRPHTRLEPFSSKASTQQRSLISELGQGI